MSRLLSSLDFLQRTFQQSLDAAVCFVLFDVSFVVVAQQQHSLVTWRFTTSHLQFVIILSKHFQLHVNFISNAFLFQLHFKVLICLQLNSNSLV